MIKMCLPLVNFTGKYLRWSFFFNKVQTPLFWSGPKLRSEWIFKLSSSASKIHLNIDFLLLPINFLPSCMKKIHSQKLCFRDPNVLKSKFFPKPHWGGLTYSSLSLSPPLEPPVEFKLLIYSSSSEICKGHTCLMKSRPQFRCVQVCAKFLRPSFL